jgi:hypothetical protein
MLLIPKVQILISWFNYTLFRRLYAMYIGYKSNLLVRIHMLLYVYKYIVHAHCDFNQQSALMPY